MATHLLTVGPQDHRDSRLAPLMPLIRFRDRPELAALVPGCRIEVRLPDGTQIPVRLKRLVVDGIDELRNPPWDHANAFLDGKPLIRLKFSPGLSQALTPTGTELWFDEKPAADDEFDDL